LRGANGGFYSSPRHVTIGVVAQPVPTEPAHSIFSTATLGTFEVERESRPGVCQVDEGSCYFRISGSLGKLAYVYSRENPNDAHMAQVLTRHAA
jgi:hypothetical protein